MLNIVPSIRNLTLCCAAVLLAAPAFAQNNAAAPAAPPTEPRAVVGKYDNPSGVAVHENGDIFVAARDGVFRLFKNPDTTKKGLVRKKEIAAGSTDIYGKGPMYNIGALGVALLDAQHLVVGDGSRKDGEELIRVYKIGATAPEKPAKEDSAAFTLGPIKAGDASAMGEGNYYGIAVTGGAIFVTANGDDTKGWIVRSEVAGGKPGDLKPFIATKTALSVDAPCAITVDKAGDLVVGQMGEVNVAGDSIIAIFDAKTGKLKAKYETGLSDIVGLAYSPKNGKLYGVDFSWADTTKGGLFELTIAGDKCTAKKLFAFDKPTAIAFEKNGAALVTAFGTAKEGSDDLPGQLFRIAPRLLP